MEKITKYFKYSYDNDTTIEYVITGLYSMLNCSFTSEDPDYGTDTIHYTSVPVKSIEQMAYEMLGEVKDFLDWRDGSVEAPRCDVHNDYGEYSNSTLIAIEYALSAITKNYHPTKWYATIRDAGRFIANALLEDRTRIFAFCESDREEAKGNPNDHIDEGGWHGIKRIHGFFDNEDSEFIVAIGHYGGGNVGFAYVDWADADDSTCEDELVRAICKATGWDADNMIFVEEDTDVKEGK